MRTVLVANVKGGCGKTTIATNLAAAFAAAGRATALADADRQRSSLDWLARRPETAAPIAGLSWSKRRSDPPKGTQRLVIDAPAAIGGSQTEDLVRLADIVLVPVLPSVFDEMATRRFIERIEEIKAVRKQRKNLALVANRVRTGSRAAERLEAFFADLGHEPAGRIVERALYSELADRGLALFDVNTRQTYDLALPWLPLLEFLEGAMRGR